MNATGDADTIEPRSFPPIPVRQHSKAGLVTLPRRLTIRSSQQLRLLTEMRLLAYRKKALSLENSPEASDYTQEQIRSFDQTSIWFKSDPRWSLQYERILEALANAQSHATKRRTDSAQ